ncbi:MAG: inorganic diphosphatase [Candidatus Paceibacterota bacterium]|jgi:inorganic pyrophosphatase
MKAIIEIPKGDDRRRHMKYDKTGFIDLGPTKDVIPVNDGIMPVHYGYISDTFNEKEGDEIDILVFSKNTTEVGQEIEFKPIALIKRDDGDDKIVAVDETMGEIKEWNDIPKMERDLIESFFSYHHKFLSIENGEIAKQYIENGNEIFLRS